MSDIEYRVVAGQTTHILIRVPEPKPSRTRCGRIVSGLVWWEGMPVTSSPPAFPLPSVVNCKDCLA